MKGPKCKFCGLEHFGPCPKISKDRSSLRRLMDQKPAPKQKQRPGAGGKRGA